MEDSRWQLKIIGLTAFGTISLGVGLFFSLQNNVSTNLLEVPNAEDASASYDARIQKGDALMQAGDYENASASYAYALKLDPSISTAYQKLATAYLASGDIDKAVINAQAAYERNASTDILLLYTQSVLQKKDWPTAQSLLEKADTQNQRPLYLKGLLALMQGNHEDAHTQFTAALSTSGSLTPAMLQNFVSAYEAFSASQGANEAYRNALLCKALLDADEYVLAEELAIQTLKQKNDYRDVWMILGYAQMQQKKYAEAEDSFKTAKKIDSVKPEIHYFLGMSYFEQNKYKDAIDSLELAILYGFQPETEIYKTIAHSYEALGQYPDALASYEHWINLGADSAANFQAPVDLALEEIQDVNRAFTLAQKATTLFPEEALSHTLLAKVYLAKGDTTLAKRSIEKAFSLDPDFALAHFTAAKLYEQDNDLSNATDEYKKAYELSAPGDALGAKAAERYNELILNPSQE